MRTIAKLRWSRFVILISTSLLLNLTLVSIIQATGPDDQALPKAVNGLSSSTLSCLTVGAGSVQASGGTVHLTWSGRADAAYIVLGVAGAEAPHSIKVNGQVVAQVPVHPGGQACSNDEVVRLAIPPAVLLQGENGIEIVNDAQGSDAWSAAQVSLGVMGDLQVDLADRYKSTPVSQQMPTKFVISFTNTFDGSAQEFEGQIPTGYDGDTPTPLLLAVHPRNQVKEWGANTFGDAADNRGWLLASPELHGRWQPPQSPSKPGAYAYASLESQYDVLDTVVYMVQNYNVDPTRIYLAGYSMGGQGGVVMVAKNPHIFAAIFDNKGPSDMAAWYEEQLDYYNSPPNTNREQIRAMREECYIDNGGSKIPAYPNTSLGTPANPFCYQRRSGVSFAGNYINTPISITHSISDALVPITNSYKLRDAINSFNPTYPVSIYIDPDAIDPDNGQTCTGSFHCFDPDSQAVLGFLEQYTLNNNPGHINITTDESKPYYWMNVLQSGGGHWSQISVWRDTPNKTVTASISDTNPVSIGFNLGVTAVNNILVQPGMGLPSTTYLIKEQGQSAYLKDYENTGYFTPTLVSTGQYSVTMSALSLIITADPPQLTAGPSATSTITVVVTDNLGSSVPNGTVVTFTTSTGNFTGSGTATETSATTNGQAQVVLTGVTDSADVEARVGLATASTTIPANVIYLPIILASKTTVLASSTQPMQSEITVEIKKKQHLMRQPRMGRLLFSRPVKGIG